MSQFANTLTGLARERGLGYERLAHRSSLSPVFVWRLMDGQKAASYLTVYRLARALSQVEPKQETKEPTVEFNWILGRLLIAAVNDAVAKPKESRRVKAG